MLPQSWDSPPRPEPGSSTEPIPVLRPRLPPADRLLPYLQRIDRNRWYTNWGPLASELERRLAAHFGLPGGTVVSAASGCAALVGAILGSAGRAARDRPIAILPAYTFVGTASAVEQCGYRVHLADISPDDWALRPDLISHHPGLDRVGLVVVVSPFGRPIAQDPWDAFQRRAGIPVVIDGAASFEALSAAPAATIGRLPVALSFHAVKSFACGEGGCVVTTDPALGVRVTTALNFGIFEDRQRRSAGINGKMSEYHAAVGLAELDSWPEKQRQLGQVIDRYRGELDAVGAADRVCAAPTVASCYVLFRCTDLEEAGRVEASLTASGIEFRHWYGGGLLAQPHLAYASHDPLTHTNRLAPLVLGLPVAPDLAPDAIARVARALTAALHGSRLVAHGRPDSPIEDSCSPLPQT